eukprot:365738-Chlamydomonas_euryale.AAC.26
MAAKPFMLSIVHVGMKRGVMHGMTREHCCESVYLRACRGVVQQVSGSGSSDCAVHASLCLWSLPCHRSGKPFVSSISQQPRHAGRQAGGGTKIGA